MTEQDTIRRVAAAMGGLATRTFDLRHHARAASDVLSEVSQRCETEGHIHVKDGGDPEEVENLTQITEGLAPVITALDALAAVVADFALRCPALADALLDAIEPPGDD